MIRMQQTVARYGLPLSRFLMLRPSTLLKAYGCSPHSFLNPFFLPKKMNRNAVKHVANPSPIVAFHLRPKLHSIPGMLSNTCVMRLLLLLRQSPRDAPQMRREPVVLDRRSRYYSRQESALLLLNRRVPHLSRLRKRREWQQVRHIRGTYTRKKGGDEVRPFHP